MKKTLSLLVAGLAIAGLSSSNAQAADTYVSGNVGINWMNDFTSDSGDGVSHKTGINLKGAIGKNLGQFRVEGELGYQANSLDMYTDSNGNSSPLNGYTSILSLMVNGYYDLTKSGIQPYLMAGTGVAAVRIHDTTEPLFYSNTTLAYQVGAGVAVPLSHNVKCDLSYRYFATTDIADLGKNLSSNQLDLGLRYSF